MSLFATEFPIKDSITAGEFVAQVIAWLRGNRFSTVLDKKSNHDLDTSFAHLRGQNGEELLLRSLENSDGSIAFGFRHDIKDDEGSLWRTEAVLKQNFPSLAGNFIRFKTQCTAIGPTARIDTPRKPYLIRTLIKDNWPINDGTLHITDTPIWLTDDPRGLEQASNITLGASTHHLPVVYISAKGTSKWEFSAEDIDKLAYDLGGVAHVVVEPSRNFAGKLKDVVDGKNAYGGSIGIIAPKHGLLKKIFSMPESSDSASLISAVRKIATIVRSQTPALGWDWINLQEESLYIQRIKERQRLTAAEIEDLYQNEIIAKNERIQELETQLSQRPIDVSLESNEEYLLSQNLVRRIGPEIYDEEFSDRVRAAIRCCLTHAEADGLDKRSIFVLQSIVENTSNSDDLIDLKSDIKRAATDMKRISSEMRDILVRHGYLEKADKKHIRLEAKPTFSGLEPITLSKTPSDYRGLKNTRSQVEKTLGITKLLD